MTCANAIRPDYTDAEFARLLSKVADLTERGRRGNALMEVNAFFRDAYLDYVPPMSAMAARSMTTPEKVAMTEKAMRDHLRACVWGLHYIELKEHLWPDVVESED
jgi:hypothetical protein